MTWIEIAQVIATLAGFSAITPIIINYMIKRHEHKIEREEKVDEAQVEDAGKFREELWREYKGAIDRNDNLSTRYGVALQEKATLAGQLEAANKQIADMVQRLTVEGQRVFDAEDRAKRDRTAREAAESRYELLIERHKELERDYARVARGHASRRSDLTDLDDMAGESTRLTPARKKES